MMTDIVSWLMSFVVIHACIFHLIEDRKQRIAVFSCIYGLIILSILDGLYLDGFIFYNFAEKPLIWMGESTITLFDWIFITTYSVVGWSVLFTANNIIIVSAIYFAAVILFVMFNRRHEIIIKSGNILAGEKEDN